ncbi:MACPF domain-containing protein [Nymphaea thermarum]|nr:MACPF domain-containing protein [Nymphaea thermarum]
MQSRVAEKAVSCLGRGFDITNDFRLKYCRGGGRLVLLNEEGRRDLVIPGHGVVKDVPLDIKCDKGENLRYQSDVLDFKQAILSLSLFTSSPSLHDSRDAKNGFLIMSELFNQKSSLPGKIPSGLFNSTFGFNSSSWASEMSETKSLAFDGYFISLFNLHIDRYPLLLADHVRDAVPSTWEPPAFARFIETYGTHIIVGLSIGGQDALFVRQDQTSNLPPSELKKHLHNLADQHFTGTCQISPHLRRKQKQMPGAFNVFDPEPVCLEGFSSMASKDGITVICSKRGGDVSINSHCEWLLTVPATPDAINFTLVPITSLLAGVPGKGFLAQAINLYLRYKPPIEDLEYFLYFQSQKIWAPVHSDFPLGPPANRSINPTSALQFSLMGPKLLAVHLEHLRHVPLSLEKRIGGETCWRGADELGAEAAGHYEPLQWKNFSRVCTAPVVSDGFSPTAQEDDRGGGGAAVVTGAQLEVIKHEWASVLRLRLAFTRVSGCRVMKSTWQHSDSAKLTQRSGLLSGVTMLALPAASAAAPAIPEKPIIDSGVFAGGPPSASHVPKGLRYVDTSHVCKGPDDCPGHWLVTGAKLGLEKGKIRLSVEFSLLSY